MAEQTFFMVGELAKKMNVTVRTLQYYDRIGLLPPSKQSEGGRRLYSQQDMIKLHQILSMKYLGFSLDDIKNRILPMDTVEEFGHLLTIQEKSLKQQMSELNHALKIIQSLKEEANKMETVDLRKYCDIVQLLRQDNGHYWVIKYFDEATMKKISQKYTIDSADAFINQLYSLCDQAMELQKHQLAPASPEGQTLAKLWWSLILEFTEGDLSMLPDLISVHEDRDNWKDHLFKEKWNLANEYIQAALEVYLTQAGVEISLDA